MVTSLYGRVTGYMIGAIETARQSLQPLMLTYGFDSFTTEGAVTFASRGAGAATEVLVGELVSSAKEATLAGARSAPSEAPGRVALEFVRSDIDYQPGAAEAVSPLAAETDVAQSSVPLVLSQGLAKVVAERWLAESRISRDSVQFTLPPSRLAFTAGDIVSLTVAGRSNPYRIDRIEELGPRHVTAVRIEPGLFDAPVREAPPRPAAAAPTLTPVHAEFLDLPLLTGDEDPSAPHIAIAKTPWAGPVAVYSASDDYGYVLNREILRPATLGETLEPLTSGTPGVWTQDTVRVRLVAGVLQSRGRTDVLNGANAAALRYGDDGDWEVVQFASAQLVGPDEYVLGGLLRGQAGTDGMMPTVWPAGTDFVLIDDGVTQLKQSSSMRSLERHYRIGPAARSYDDASFLHEVRAFAGVGLRPYRPAHLSAVHRTDGGIELSWVRRTRIDGDSWEGTDVPIGEERELYSVRIRRGDAVLREFSPVETRQIYAQAQRTEDGVSDVCRRGGPGFQPLRRRPIRAAGPWQRDLTAESRRRLGRGVATAVIVGVSARATGATAAVVSQGRRPRLRRCLRAACCEPSPSPHARRPPRGPSRPAHRTRASRC